MMKVSGSPPQPAEAHRASTLAVSEYLEERYWWAYVRPWSVAVWDHMAVVNAILLGNYSRLRSEALREFGEELSGRTLQMGCCYGDMTPRLHQAVSRSGGTLDVIDILPTQIENARRKLAHAATARFMRMDAAALEFSDASYDRVLMFFLPHEQPPHIRERSISEALRVLKPEGKLIIMDYGKPSRWHPVRFLLLPLLAKIEPFAKAQWNAELVDTLPRRHGRCWHRTGYFGGLYQKIVNEPLF